MLKRHSGRSSHVVKVSFFYVIIIITVCRSQTGRKRRVTGSSRRGERKKKFDHVKMWNLWKFNLCDSRQREMRERQWCNAPRERGGNKNFIVRVWPTAWFLVRDERRKWRNWNSSISNSISHANDGDISSNHQTSIPISHSRDINSKFPSSTTLAVVLRCQETR